MALKNETGKTYYFGARKISPGEEFPAGLPDAIKSKIAAENEANAKKPKTSKKKAETPAEIVE